MGCASWQTIIILLTNGLDLKFEDPSHYQPPSLSELMLNGVGHRTNKKLILFGLSKSTMLSLGVADPLYHKGDKGMKN